MIDNIFVDTNVIIYFLTNEKDVRSFISENFDNIKISSQVLNETINTLSNVRKFNWDMERIKEMIIKRSLYQQKLKKKLKRL